MVRCPSGTFPQWLRQTKPSPRYGVSPGTSPRVARHFLNNRATLLTLMPYCSAILQRGIPPWKLKMIFCTVASVKRSPKLSARPTRPVDCTLCELVPLPACRSCCVT